MGPIVYSMKMWEAKIFQGEGVPRLIPMETYSTCGFPGVESIPPVPL